MDISSKLRKLSSTMAHAWSFTELTGQHVTFAVEGQGVDRRMVFCDNLLSKYNAAELYTTCHHCNLFLCVCCLHSSSHFPCLHYPVVFTDGACSGNRLQELAVYSGRIQRISGAYPSMTVLTQCLSEQTSARSCWLQ
jgi:hypothetical protein